MSKAYTRLFSPIYFWQGPKARISLIVSFISASIFIIGCFLSLANFNGPSTSQTHVYSTPLTVSYEGWGTSLAWWANYAGSNVLTDTQRTDLMNLFFSQTSNNSLKLNIVRYNIGASGPIDWQGFTAMDSRLRRWGGVPSLINQQGVYDWNADANQVKIMQQARDLGVNVFEAFSNSPPWFMTISGSPQGMQGGGDNLDSSNYAAFAVVANAPSQWGITFNYLEPFNEPNSGWWKYDTNQEGCDFEPASQAAFLPFLKTAMANHNLQTLVSLSDAWSLDAAVRNLKQGASFDYANKINIHGYGWANGLVENNAEWWNGLRQVLRNKTPPPVQHFWMSEVGGFGTGKRAIINLAVTVIQDLNVLRASGWVYWQVIDTAPEWALVVISPDNPWCLCPGVYNPSPSVTFYALQQFSAHIRPGDAILSTSRSGFKGLCIICVVVSYSASEGRLTIVAVNTGSLNLDHTFDWPSFGNVPQVSEVYRTCIWRQEYHSLVDSMTNSNNELTTTLFGYSITTIVLTGF